ncbi:hypothetical protein B0T19DRAFT_17455 [Cercophora scortea]|uniref:BTB domain-containing protein n=1 Tax=Cercophora scortea TaxID=314031 RepID=A0AAE0J325_9PEZI|nr:hypothetical protein B0T19DRAFT_17455 [Cercophora scortea]
MPQTGSTPSRRYADVARGQKSKDKASDMRNRTAGLPEVEKAREPAQKPVAESIHGRPKVTVEVSPDKVSKGDWDSEDGWQVPRFSYAEAVKGKRAPASPTKDSKPNPPAGVEADSLAEPPPTRILKGGSPEKTNSVMAMGEDAQKLSPFFQSSDASSDQMVNTVAVVKKTPKKKQRRSPKRHPGSANVVGKKRSVGSGSQGGAPKKISKPIAEMQGRPRRFSTGDRLFPSHDHIGTRTPVSREVAEPRNIVPSNVKLSSLDPISTRPGRVSPGIIDPDLIDAKILEAVAQEERRREIVDARSSRTQAVIQDHDHGLTQLWESQFEWDVLIRCRSSCWKVHHDILCRESDWFKERLPPKDPWGGYVVFDCSLHQEQQLANVLNFMYEKKYDGAVLIPKFPLDGESIRKNVFMYICGASVNCQSMMKYATDAINAATEIVQQLIPSQYYRSDLICFYQPLTCALAMLYSQHGRGQLMFAMRLAMAKLVDVCLLWLFRNQVFRDFFQATWGPALYFECMMDNHYFHGLGLLDGEAGTLGTQTTGTAGEEDQRASPEIAAIKEEDKMNDRPRVSGRSKKSKKRNGMHGLQLKSKQGA